MEKSKTPGVRRQRRDEKLELKNVLNRKRHNIPNRYAPTKESRSGKVSTMNEALKIGSLFYRRNSLMFILDILKSRLVFSLKKEVAWNVKTD